MLDTDITRIYQSFAENVADDDAIGRFCDDTYKTYFEDGSL